MLSAGTACAGVDNPPVDSGIDVSGQLCAGLRDATGEEVVPTRTTNGCVGATIAGVLTCPDCSIVAGENVELYEFADNSDNITLCASANLDTSYAFSFPRVAPDSYAIFFSGQLASGGTGSAALYFDVCSDALDLEGTVEKDLYW